MAFEFFFCSVSLFKESWNLLQFKKKEQIRKIEILKKRKRRLEKALIRKYKEQKLANSKLENQRLKSQNSLNFNARTGVACRKTANIIKNETMITRIEKRLSNLKG